MPWPAIEIYDCRHGRFAHFRGDPAIGRFLAKFGEWAEVELALLKQFIPKSGLVLDVGANIGTHAIAFARMVGADGAVIAIEAVPVALHAGTGEMSRWRRVEGHGPCEFQEGGDGWLLS